MGDKRLIGFLMPWPQNVKYVLLLSSELKFSAFSFSDAPVVDLTFGANLDPANIAEGNDVYFECAITANPDVYKVVWLHDVSC